MGQLSAVGLDADADGDGPSAVGGEVHHALIGGLGRGGHRDAVDGVGDGGGGADAVLGVGHQGLPGSGDLPAVAEGVKIDISVVHRVAQGAGGDVVVAGQGLVIGRQQGGALGQEVFLLLLVLLVDVEIHHIFQVGVADGQIGVVLQHHAGGEVGLVLPGVVVDIGHAALDDDQGLPIAIVVVDIVQLLAPAAGGLAGAVDVLVIIDFFFVEALVEHIAGQAHIVHIFVAGVVAVHAVLGVVQRGPDQGDAGGVLLEHPGKADVAILIDAGVVVVPAVALVVHLTGEANHKASAAVLQGLGQLAGGGVVHRAHTAGGLHGELHHGIQVPVLPHGNAHGVGQPHAGGLVYGREIGVVLVVGKAGDHAPGGLIGHAVGGGEGQIEVGGVGLEVQRHLVPAHDVHLVAGLGGLGLPHQPGIIGGLLEGVGGLGVVPQPGVADRHAVQGAHHPVLAGHLGHKVGNALLQSRQGGGVVARLVVGYGVVLPQVPAVPLRGGAVFHVIQPGAVHLGLDGEHAAPQGVGAAQGRHQLLAGRVDHIAGGIERLLREDLIAVDDHLVGAQLHPDLPGAIADKPGVPVPVRHQAPEIHGPHQRQHGLVPFQIGVAGGIVIIRDRLPVDGHPQRVGGHGDGLSREPRQHGSQQQAAQYTFSHEWNALLSFSFSPISPLRV